MKYIETRINWTKKLGAAVALGAFTVAPHFGAPQAAQADPKDHAPAHGYRRKQDSNAGDRNQTQRYTLNGIVTNATAGNMFTVRTDSGRIVRVQSNSTPRNLSTGDRVTVSGYASNGVFIGESVRVVRDSRDDRDNRDEWFDRDRDRDRDEYGDNDWFRRGGTTETTVYGTVTRDLGGNTFEVRTDDGRLITVRARNGEPNRLTRGDQVVAQGRFNQARDVFAAETVRITRNVDGGRVNFPGTVASIDSRNQLRVRGDNGRTYTVNARTALPTTIRKGDRVRITGDVRNGIVIASRVQEVTRDRNDRDSRDDDNDRRIEFTGTVVTAGWMGQQLTIRRDDGKQFNITAPRGTANFRNGDRVRVVGWKTENGRVQATSITRF